MLDINFGGSGKLLRVSEHEEGVIEIQLQE